MATSAKQTRATNGAAATGTPVVEVENPATRQIVGTVPDLSPAQVASIAAELRAAQPEWEAMGPDRRAGYMLAWLDWILDNEDRILGIVQSESGKSSGDTKIETLVAVEVINYYAKNGAKFLEDRTVRAHNAAGKTKKLKLFHRPYQLVGQIFPWNYPLGMPMMDVPGALMSGAAVMTKPSEETPLAWSECVRGFREEIGAPKVLASVTGGGAAGAAVVDEVDMIMFTGSVKTGRRIGVRAAERLIPCSLELGGKDAMVVLDDAPLERAVGGAIWGGLFNAGQSCIAVERIYVQEGIYDEFVSKLTDEVSRLRVGSDPMGSYSAEFGALANEAQMEIVERHVRDAVDKGARVLTGGQRGEQGLFYPPTVIVDVDHTMQCMTDETFGPTLPIMKVADEDEAVTLANDSPYGLCGSVWTGDERRAERIARRMETGGVSANNVMATPFQFPLPFGGWKESGVGSRFGGPEGILKYCRRQAFTTERLDLSSEMHWYPYTKRRGKLQERLVRLIGAHDWRRRLGLKGAPAKNR